MSAENNYAPSDKRRMALSHRIFTAFDDVDLGAWERVGCQSGDSILSMPA